MSGGYVIENMIIHLIGPPGTGKYTIAKEMAQLADIRLVDNHLVNNPIFTVVREEGKPLPTGIWDTIAKIWTVMADTMVNMSPPHFSFILTNSLFEGDAGDLGHVDKMRGVAEQRKGMYVPVRLIIADIEEHRRRISDPVRRDRMKQTDPKSLERYAGREILKTGAATELTLDVTHMTAAEAAQAILDHARACKRP